MIKFVMSAAVVLTTSSAFAQSSAGQPSAPASASTVAAPDPEASRVRCRSVNLTNSRIPERICRTRAEWDEIERQSREAIERNRRGAGASGN